MRLSWRDGLATVFVGSGTVLYVLWLAGIDVGGVRIVAASVFAMGLAASVTAVVYGVGAGLLQASRIYLTIASLMGLAAFVAGVIALVAANETMLVALVASNVALWAIATVRHSTSTPAAEEEPAAETPLRQAA